MSAQSPTGFSDEDVSNAVQQIVLSTISRPLDTLGTRRVDVTFTEVQQAAANVFLLYRNAPFYILALSCLRLLENISNEATIIQSILDAIQATGRSVLPIDDLTTLANARSALLALEGAVSTRTNSFQNIQQVPAFVRYQSNVGQFLNTAGSNVKENGQIVQTPQEARSVLPGLISQLQQSHQSLIQLAVLIENGIENFTQLDLPDLVAESVITNSRKILENRLIQLQAETPEQRLKDVRRVVLDLLAQSAAIKQFGSFTGPTSILPVAGDVISGSLSGHSYSSLTHSASPANSTSILPGPYALRTSKNILDFYLDSTFSAKLASTAITSITAGPNVFEALFTTVGDFTTFNIVIGDVIYPKTGANAGSRWVVTGVTGTILTAVGDHAPNIPDVSPHIEIWSTPSISVSLANSLTAKLDGIAAEPFAITSDNRTFIFSIDGIVVTALLTTGSSRTSAQIVTDLNTAISAQAVGKPIVADTYFSPLKYDSLVAITNVSGLSYKFTVLAGQLDGLGIGVGDKVRIITGPDVNAFLTITSVATGPGILFVDATATGALASVGTNQEIQIGPANQRIRIRCTAPATCLSSGTTIAISTDPSNTGYIPLGYFLGANSTSQAVRVKNLVADFNQRTTGVLASSSLSADFTGSMHTDALFPTKVTLYKFTGVGSLIASGLSITITTAGLLASGSAIGDVVALRTGPNPNAFFVITAITDTTVTATGTVGTVNTTSVSFEIGPNLVVTPVAGRTIAIAGGPNGGSYEVASQGTIPFEFTVTTLFPLYKDPITTQAVVMSGELGIERVVFSSQNATTNSSILVQGSAADLFYPGGISPVAFGTSPWFILPSIPLGLQAGDFLEMHETNYLTPSATYTIGEIDTTLLVVAIDPEIPSNQTWTFSTTIPVPFALVKNGNVDNTTILSAGLATWASASVNQAAYFIDLNRFINPLLANTNPTAVEVNDAFNRVLDLFQLLTVDGAVIRSANTTLTLEAILDAFNVTPIPAVDTLLQTFREKGADRALDILLTGDFESFFGLTLDSSSYAGNMLATTRSVGMAVLPQSKTNRDDSISGKQLNQANSEDFEFGSSDIETNNQVSPPAGSE